MNDSAARRPGVPCPNCGHQPDTPNHVYGCDQPGATAGPRHECFDLDGTRVHGDPNMSDEARAALRTVVGTARQQLAKEAAWGGPDGYDVFTWWQRTRAPLDAVLADLRKHGVTDSDSVLRALRPVVEWVIANA